MKNRFLAGALGVLLFSGAYFAQASGLTEVQIQAIINLVASFGADQATLSNVSAALHSQAAGGLAPSYASASSCLTLSYTLSIGSTGSEVSALQDFLNVSPATGYFGLKTQAAVAAWQSAHNLQDSGQIDSQTRAAMACASNSNNYSGSSTAGSSYTPPQVVNASASIDQSSLSVSSDKSAVLVTVTGTASNVSGVTMALKGYVGGTSAVVKGRWSITIPSALTTGTYLVQISSNDTGAVLTSGTLVVNANGYATGPLMFTAGSGGAITLSGGQIATDGFAQITLTSVGYNQLGQLVANFQADIKGASTSYYSVPVGQSFPNGGGLGDDASPTGGISVMVSGVSVPNNSATIVVNTFQKGQ